MGILVVVVTVAGVVAALPPRATSSGGTQGPYALSALGGPGNAPSMQLSFPLCSNVTVRWNISVDAQWVGGGEGNVTFTVWTPAPPQNSTCAGPATAENLTCPRQGCPA